MPAPKQPQDHQKKKVKATAYTFKHEATTDGEAVTKTYTLPLATEAVALSIPGRITRDAMIDDDGAGELRMGLAMVENCEAAPEALAALYEKSTGEMMRIVIEWMNFKPDEDEPSLGESSPSTD